MDWDDYDNPEETLGFLTGEIRSIECESDLDRISQDTSFTGKGVTEIRIYVNVSSFEAIRKFYSVETVKVLNKEVTAIDYLQYFTNAHNLTIHNTEIAVLENLERMPSLRSAHLYLNRFLKEIHIDPRICIVNALEMLTIRKSSLLTDFFFKKSATNSSSEGLKKNSVNLSSTLRPASSITLR